MRLLGDPEQYSMYYNNENPAACYTGSEAESRARVAAICDGFTQSEASFMYVSVRAGMMKLA
jgi:hypothetical protein